MPAAGGWAIGKAPALRLTELAIAPTTGTERTPTDASTGADLLSRGPTGSDLGEAAARGAIVLLD